MNNLLSFDLEHWYSSEFISGKCKPDKELNKEDKELVESPTNAILALLNKHNTKAIPQRF